MERILLFCLIALLSSANVVRVCGQIPSDNTDLTTASTDSAGTQLDELVVQGRTQRIIKNGVEYIPGKNMKKTALDAVSLLYNMQIPKLVVSPIDYTVTTPTGQEVAMFIDYVRASMADVSGLRPEDVLRVEVLDYPPDPRFEGSPRVVNFIMKRYEWGGYTKLTAIGRTLNGNFISGEVYNKFVAGKWTIDAFVNSYGVWMDKQKREYADIFRNFNYQGTDIGEITRRNKTDEYYQKSNTEQASVRFAYQSDSKYISHSVGFNRNATPYLKSNSAVDFSRGFLPSTEAVNTDRTQSITARLSGYYRFNFTGGNTLAVSWSYAHSGNNLSSIYELNPEPPIYNGNRELVNSPQANISYSKNLGHNNMLSVTIASVNSFFDTDYTGSYDGKQKTVSSENIAIAEYTHSWGFGLSLFARAGASYTLARLNGENLIHRWNPRAGIQVQYQPNNKNIFSIEGWLYNSHPEPSRANSALVRNNELLWSQGNPDLKNILGRSCEASYTFIPRNNFALSASVNYEMGINHAFYDYITVPGLDGLVRTYGFDNREKQLKGLVTASLRLFNNSLGFYLQGGVKRQVNSGAHPMNKSSFIGLAQVSYFIGNFAASAYYAPPTKDIYELSGVYRWRPCTYGINLSYALKAFKFRLDVVNVFSSGHVRESYNSDHYEMSGWKWVSGLSKSLRLTATYTLPYGKKVNRNNELRNETNSSSAILER